jgi:ATP-binding cassette subfamily B protein
MDRFVAARLVWVTSLVIAGSMIAALTPLVFKLILDAAGPAQPAADATVAWLIVACAGSHWLSRIIGESRCFFFTRVERRLFRALSRRLFEHILHLPLRYHLQRRTGALSQTLAEGLLAFQLTLQHCVFTLLPLLAEIVTMVAVLATLDRPEFLGIIGCSVACQLVVQVRAVAQMSGPARAASGAWIDANGVLTDSILNYETIKYFGAETAMRERYDASLARSETEWLRLFRRRALSGFASATVLGTAVAMALLVAVRDMRAGTMTVAEFVLVNTYLLQALHPLEVVGHALRDLVQGSASLGRLLELMREPREPPGQRGRREQRGPGELAFEAVSMSYRADRPVLRDVSFCVAPAQKVGIVGASGAGKSSLVRLLTRLTEPEQGRILLDGTPIDELDLAYLRSTVAVVPQDPTLFNESLRYNIAIARPECSAESIRRAVRLAGLEPFIASLPDGYDTMVGERGMRLSGGERQRIAIARAVLREGRVLVFDEATSSLDTRTESEIQQRLDELARSVTTLVIAHRLSTVCRADRIIVLDAGAIVESGTHAGLLRQDGYYAALWRAQERAAVERASTAGSPVLANVETDDST